MRRFLHERSRSPRGRVVAPVSIVFDVIENLAFFLLPAGLWLVLYLAAWSNDGIARSAGFGRGVFWVLLPGALIGSLGNLPFFSWGSDVLAINIGGGLIPVVLSVVLLLQAPNVSSRATLAFLGAFALQSLAWFALVVNLGHFSASWMAITLALAIAAGPAVAFVVLRTRDPSRAYSWNQATLLSILTAGVVLVTFATTETVPGQGILSSFPEYLVAPIAVGIIAGLLGAMSSRDHPAGGLRVAYAASTFGVLIGADLLRQPPLYVGSTPALYAIGGAGVLDLLYLSGLLSVTVAYLVVRRVLIERGTLVSRAPATARDASPPVVLLREAWTSAHTGNPQRAVGLCAQAVDNAAIEAREMMASPAVPGRPAWEGLPFPVWAMQDYQNLKSLARQPAVGPGDGVRAWVTARALVRMALDLSGRRFAPWGKRAKAFALDLLIVTFPSVAFLALVIAFTPGSFSDLLGSVALNAAVLGIAAYGFLYFVLSEGLTGRTLGKAYLGLEVRERHLRTAGTLPVMMRNVPKLIPLTALAVGLGEIIALGLRGGSLLGPNTGIPVLEFTIQGLVLALGTVLVILIAGGVSVFLISRSLESQRFGDYLAGTWVVFDRPVVNVPAPPVGAWSPPAG